MLRNALSIHQNGISANCNVQYKTKIEVLCEKCFDNFRLNDEE